jgi:amino acid transporter
MSVTSIRRILVGEALPTAHAIHQRLTKLLALPVFGADAISSSAYATEEILLALVLVGSVALHYAAGVALAIAGLFVIVSISYRQTVMAYPSGGGAYIVAKDNLGPVPGLIAASALLNDYILTVAVSVAAGIAAIVSAAPELAPFRVHLAVLAVALIALANLRGARESGSLFAPPVYLFVGAVLVMVGVGAFRVLAGLGPVSVSAVPVPPDGSLQAVTFVLLLRAFASGCAALTGIEAVSNGVPAFRKPESHNAAATLLWMVGICVTLFMGITVLTQAFHIIPDRTGSETVLSMLGRAAFGTGFLYFVLQASTAAVLILAANTAFADFPRLSSILARDGYAPKQLSNLGDRLVFANGIAVLGLLASLLLVLFQGRTHLLIPLYAVGVFVSFTLSQVGMVIHWRRVRGTHWHAKAAVNALGAVTTAVVLVVVGSVKFLHGAWMVLLLIPIVMLACLRIARHYRGLTRLLELPVGEAVELPALRHAAVVLVGTVDRGVGPALAYAKSISPQVEAVSVAFSDEQTALLQEEWLHLGNGVRLTVLPSPTQSVIDPVVRYLHHLRTESEADLVTVVMPELVLAHWWERPLHRQSALLRAALTREPGIAVSSLRYQAGA